MGNVARLFAFALLAWWLFKRRKMETAGDTVAIPVLRPVFVYCMTFGAAFVLADLLNDMLNLELSGRAMTLTLLLFMLLGAVLGYFLARMIVEKSFRVFRGHWKGCLISLAVIVLVIGACELDVFGFETKLPSADEIESVRFNTLDSLREPETIEEVLELHQNLIANKDWHETAQNSRGESLEVSDEDICVSRNLYLCYHLKNGKTLWRGYQIFGDTREMADPDSDICRMEEILNMPESIALRCTTAYPMEPENVTLARLTVMREDPNGYYQENIILTPEELIDLWTNAALHDVEEGHFGRTELFPADRGWQKTNVGLNFILVKDAEEFLAHVDSERRVEVRTGADYYTETEFLACFVHDIGFLLLCFCVIGLFLDELAYGSFPSFVRVLDCRERIRENRGLSVPYCGSFVE